MGPEHGEVEAAVPPGTVRAPAPTSGPGAAGGISSEAEAAADDPNPGGTVGEGGSVPDPLPEADSAETAEAWEEADAMDGEAPTG